VPDSSVRISFVLPVYQVEDYLTECLDSILSEPGDHLEVVAIDDASPDGCGRLLDEYSSRDPRVRVVHLDRNGGLGAARNLGLDQARGEYIWFIDSDDRLVDGAVAAVAERLTQTSPDVLICDFANLYPGGRLERDQWHRLFRDPPPPAVFTLSERPSVLNLTMTVWNKVVRRDFLLGLGVRFGPGNYEDLSVTYPILMAAQRLTLLDQVCYHYRRGRAGAITQTRSARHTDVFDQYTQIFEFLDKHDADEFRTLVFDRTVRQSTTLFATRGLVPPESRRAFFHRMARHFLRFQPAGYAYPGGVRGVQYRLVEWDAYLPYAVLQALSKGRVAGRGLRGPAATTVRLGKKAVQLLYYHLYKRLPIDDDLAVYGAYWYRRPACNPAAIHAAARALAPSVRGIWVVRKDQVAALPPGTDYVVPGTTRYLRVMARAKYLVNNVNFPHEMSKRRGSVHVQTQHGTPLKTMGLDLRGRPLAARGMNFARLAEHCRRWDYVISANPHSTKTWQRVYPGDYQVLEIGSPRNDRLLTAGPEEIKKIRAELGIPEGSTAVLYAPTRREQQTAFTDTLDLARAAAALGPGHVLLVRAHYSHDGAGELPSPGGDGATLVDVSAHPSIEDLCLAADVLITDYSSIMFDYVCLDRPIVIHAPDWEAYRHTRGVYFDLLAEPPGVVATTTQELIGLFRSGAVWDVAATARRAAFRDRFCPYDDGHAAERAVRHIFLRDG
jgi:CDP-glycerol glycerophosphotransferase